MKQNAWWSGKLWLLAAGVALGSMSAAVADDTKADDAKPAAEMKKDDVKAAAGEVKKDVEVKSEIKTNQPAAVDARTQRRAGGWGGMTGKFWEREGAKEQLKLTDEQIKKLNAGFAATDEEITKLTQEMRANFQSRREAGETIDDAKKAEMDKKTEELRTKMEALQAKRQTVIKDVLDDDQEKALEKMQAEQRTRRGARGEGQGQPGQDRANRGENAGQDKPKTDDAKPKTDDAKPKTESEAPK